MAATYGGNGETYSRSETKNLATFTKANASKEKFVRGVAGAGCKRVAGPAAPVCPLLIGMADWDWSLTKSAMFQAAASNQCLRIENQRTRDGAIPVPMVDSSARCTN